MGMERTVQEIKEKRQQVEMEQKQQEKKHGTV